MTEIIASAAMMHVVITLYFKDREPAEPYRVTVPRAACYRAIPIMRA